MILGEVFSSVEFHEGVRVTFPDGVFDLIKDEPYFEDIVDWSMDFHGIFLSVYGLEDLCCGESDMFRGDEGGFFFGSSHKGPSGEVIGLSEESTGSLVDGGEGRFIEGVCFETCDFEVMSEVEFHLLSVDSLEMASGDDP